MTQNEYFDVIEIVNYLFHITHLGSTIRGYTSIQSNSPKFAVRVPDVTTVRARKAPPESDYLSK